EGWGVWGVVWCFCQEEKRNSMRGCWLQNGKIFWLEGKKKKGQRMGPLPATTSPVVMRRDFIGVPAALPFHGGGQRVAILGRDPPCSGCPCLLLPRRSSPS